MKFLADECCDAGAVAALRADGHDVVYVVESQKGAADSDVLRRAYAERRILLTEDKDFGELLLGEDDARVASTRADLEAVLKAAE